MDNSPLDPGGLPEVPDQVLQDMAVSNFKSKLRLALAAISRAQDNEEHVAVNSTAREYAAGQLRRAAVHIAEAQGILVEHGCTIDLDDGVDDAIATEVMRIGYHRVQVAAEGGAN